MFDYTITYKEPVQNLLPYAKALKGEGEAVSSELTWLSAVRWLRGRRYCMSPLLVDSRNWEICTIVFLRGLFYLLTTVSIDGVKIFIYILLCFVF